MARRHRHHARANLGGCFGELPTMIVNRKTYFVDSRLRELRNVADRFVLGVLDGKAVNKSGFGASDVSLPRQLENIERSIIEDGLRRKQGDVQATAVLLNIPKQTLYDKIKRLAGNVDGIREGAIVRSGP